MEDSYLKIVLKQTPRLLGLLDKRSFSDSYGCFDRSYWKYKTKNFSNARLQEAALTLCLLFFKNSDDNPYYKNEKTKKLSIAACNYWVNIQRKDGSFDEYILNEKSHVATVFSSYCVAYCYYLFNLNNPKILNALKKAAEWININDDLSVTNHDAAAIPFFYIMSQITKDKKYINYLKTKIKKVINNQNHEGWFKEYNGADIGYQSYTIYYLAKYYIMSKDNSILNHIEKAIKFFKYFIHPDGTIGGMYGSRDTNLILPAGFEIIKNDITSSFIISQKIKESVISKKIINPHSFDDRFLAEELYTYLDFDEKPKKKDPNFCLPYEGKRFKKLFRDAGIYVVKWKEHYLIINLTKGGIGKLFIKDNLQKNLLPYSFKKKDKIYSTYGPSTFDIQDDKISINSHFYVYQTRFQTFFSAIALGIINQIGLGKFAKKIIRKRLIHKIKKSKYSFKREIKLEKSEIHINDSFKGINKDLPKTSNFSPIYSTSTEFVSKPT